jgi:hypothetical protein
LQLQDGRDVTLRVEVNPRARRISLRLDPVSRHVVAVAPNPRLTGEAAAFAKSRLAWVAAQLSRLPNQVLLAPGQTIPFRGEACRLIWTPGRAPAAQDGGALVAGGGDEQAFAARIRRFLHLQARTDLVGRVVVHAAALGVAPTRITVKDTASRWGSCTARGALSFSWRVILAPPFVLDYLAAHEVAHLREMNHSARFWRLVAECIPDFARAESWLDRHGASLHAIDPKR